MIETSAGMWVTALVIWGCLLFSTFFMGFMVLATKKVWAMGVTWLCGVATSISFVFLLWTVICNIIVYLKK